MKRSFFPSGDIFSFHLPGIKITIEFITNARMHHFDKLQSKHYSGIIVADGYPIGFGFLPSILEPPLKMNRFFTLNVSVITRTCAVKRRTFRLLVHSLQTRSRHAFVGVAMRDTHTELSRTDAHYAKLTMADFFP